MFDKKERLSFRLRNRYGSCYHLDLFSEVGDLVWGIQPPIKKKMANKKTVPFFASYVGHSNYQVCPEVFLLFYCFLPG